METLQISKATSIDGSRKYRRDLGSGRVVEYAFFSVPGRERPNIACVSTQLGCAVGCPFCAAAYSQFFRNLTSDEIFFQIESILEDQPSSLILDEGFEVSFMGTGEPLANLRNLLEAVRQIGAKYPQVSRVSVSTAGPAKRIDALTDAMPTVPAIHLQLSLHATSDAVRAQLVPNAPGSIPDLLEAGKRFHGKTGDQVYLNYVLLKGINDSDDDAKWLARLDRKAFFLKIAALNMVSGLPKRFKAASMDEIAQFSSMLNAYELPHKIFVGDGLDVQASCGQLASVPRELNV